MKVVIASTHGEAGGAARAALRLHAALAHAGVAVTRLVQRRDGQQTDVETVSRSDGQTYTRLRLALDQLPTLRYGVAKNRPMFSPAWALGHRRLLRLVGSADIINLHWVCKGFWPLRVLRDVRLPLVWTLHDMWPLTGGCHYDESCGRFLSACGRCPVLRSDREWDLSSRIFAAKQKAYAELDLTLVAPSRWLGQLAQEAPLTRAYPVRVIPNPLDREVFAPGDRAAARARLGLNADAAVIAFLAMGGTAEPRKGFDLLSTALDRMAADETFKQTCLVVIGGDSGTLAATRFELRTVDHLSQDKDIAATLAAADVLVVPSRQDNLPNTVMEALACGVPCVAFDVGGLPDLIEHQVNGYLAKSLDTDDLARGIAWVLENPGRHTALSAAARESTARFEPQTVARQYLALYQGILKRRSA